MTQPKTRKTALSLTIAAALTVAGVAGYSAYQDAYASDEPAVEQSLPQLPRVVVETPELQTVTEWDHYAGRFEAVDEVNIRSRVTGYLQAVHFEDGDVVNKGDLLFTIDPRPFEAAVAMAKASVAEAKATLNLASADLKRSSELSKSAAISQQRVDQDRARVQQAQARVAAANSALEQAELDLEFTTIEAPITGRIDAHNVDVGNLVRGDEENTLPLTNIVSLDPIYIVFDVDQAAYLNYHKKDKEGVRESSRTAANPVNVSLQGDSDFPYQAKMDFVGNQIDQRTGTIRGRAVIDNPDGIFTPGLFARVQLLSRDNAQTVLIPDQAVALEQTNRIVYVVNENDEAETRAVTLGPIVDGKRVVRTGLEGNERVITKGLHRVSVGTKVQAEMEIDHFAELAQTRF